METLLRAFEPYRHWDPLGWVGIFRFLPVWAGLLAAAFGGTMLFFGGGRLFRAVAAPLGAAIAVIWTSPLVARVGFAGVVKEATVGATVTLFVLGLAWPPAVSFFAFGVPIGLLAGQLAGGNDWLLGFAPGFIIGGAVGVLVHRAVSAALSAAVGAWALILGLLATLAPFTGAASFLADNPIATLSIAGCFAIGGGVYQIFVRPPPEKREELKREAALKKKRDAEKKQLEDRWSSYSKTHKKGE